MIGLYAHRVVKELERIENVIIAIDPEILEDMDLSAVDAHDVRIDVVSSNPRCMPFRRGPKAILIITTPTPSRLLEVFKGFVGVSTKPSCLLIPVWSGCCGQAIEGACIDQGVVEEVARRLGFTRIEFLIPMTLEKSFGRCPYIIAACI